MGAVVIRSLESHGSENGLEVFGSTAREARHLPAVAGRGRPGVIGAIGIELALDRPRRQLEGSPPDGRLQGFEIERCDSLGADQRFDFGRNLGLEDRLEPFFSTASAVLASAFASSRSAHCSQACQYASTRWRNSRPAATC